MEEELKPRKGIKRQFLGCVVLFLGVLNTMLTLKGGLPPDIFNYMLIMIGAGILGSGILASRQGKGERST
ncbi:MAG: hypothetical protein HZB84_00700 [Deltaproteobacteria bacterium]|nr:hypothetical protein [Deltaproteobacteria bacterium]